ncbi:hypothetical protein HSX11_06445 [Oxalobacteraceae bacterium]|nr:hypothetical protein [Oxalobacteraceae bacterium]
MCIDHKKNYAAASAIFCVRFSVAAALVCGSMASAWADSGADDQRSAQGRDSRDARDNRGGSQDTRQRSDPRLDPRSFESRAEEQRRAMQESGHNAEMNRRVGRLTPDERRDLRRQINEVGQDIYATPPRR